MALALGSVARFLARWSILSTLEHYITPAPFTCSKTNSEANLIFGRFLIAGLTYSIGLREPVSSS